MDHAVGDHLVRDFLMLLVTVDPIGTLMVFLGLTVAATADERRRIALRAVGYSTVILLAFIVGGELLLGELGIRLASFQLTGGIVLFLFALQMIFGTGVVALGPAEPGHDVAVFPLALPSIASPGSILAVVMLTDNYRHSILDQGLTSSTLLLVMAITLGTLLLADRIHRVIGDAGASVSVRIMGLLLAALATEQVLEAIALLSAPAGH